MIDGLDHLVLPVRSLSTAREAWTALGFTVAPDAAHPFGTGNACIFFADGTYLEPLAIIDSEGVRAAAAAGNSFVRRARRFLSSRGEGFAMVAFATRSADAVHAEWTERGVDAGTVTRFRRRANRSDGTSEVVGFALATAEIADAPDAGVFATERLSATPLASPDASRHPNGATGLVSVTAVARNPADFHIAVSAVTGTRELRTTSFGIEARLPDGRSLNIVTPTGFALRFDHPPPDPDAGLVFAGVEIAVGAAPQLASFLPVEASGKAGVAPPTPGRPVSIAFQFAGR